MSIYMNKFIRSILMCLFFINTVHASVGQLITRYVYTCAQPSNIGRDYAFLIAKLKRQAAEQIAQARRDAEDFAYRAAMAGLRDGMLSGLKDFGVPALIIYLALNELVPSKTDTYKKLSKKENKHDVHEKQNSKLAREKAA